ncbi:MAG: hypothetical protein ABEJ90_04235, partial [Halobacterium sp.]
DAAAALGELSGGVDQVESTPGQSRADTQSPAESAASRSEGRSTDDGSGGRDASEDDEGASRVSGPMADVWNTE